MKARRRILRTNQGPHKASAGRLTIQYARILTRIFEFMLASGALRTDIKVICARALAKARPTRFRAGSELSSYLSTASLILDAWHRDRRYLDAKANPRPVPLTGSSRSVEAIARAEPGVNQPRRLIRRLERDRLIVPCGKGLYRPASSFALLTALDPVALQHVARSLAMLLDTIESNLTLPRVNGKLIERIAEIPDLPVEQVRAFREFTRMQGLVLLTTVNDWLEARRTKKVSRAKRTVHAGIHVHSYVSRPRFRACK